MAVLIKTKNDITDEILHDFINRYPFSNFAPASKFRTLIEMFSTSLADTYSDFAESVFGTFITDATGDILDTIAASYGVTRRYASGAAVPSSAKVVKFYTIMPNFGSINNGNDITIPSGTMIYGLNGDGKKVSYRVTSDTILPSTDNEKYVDVTSTGVGSDYNVPAYALNEHNFTNYTDSNNNTLLVMNATAITFAVDDESDENLRFRILQQIQSIASGNRTSVEIAALGVPGVADVKTIEHTYGSGTASLFIKAVTPTVPDALISAVQDAIDEKKPVGSMVIAEKPIETGVAIAATILFKDGASTTEKNEAIRSAKSAIIDYINNMDIGEKLFISDLARVIINSHQSIKSIGESTKLFDKITVYKKDALGYVEYTITGDVYNTRQDEKLYVFNTNNSIILR